MMKTLLLVLGTAIAAASPPSTHSAAAESDARVATASAADAAPAAAGDPTLRERQVLDWQARMIRERGRKLSRRERTHVESRLETLASQVDRRGRKHDAEMAARLAAEFGLPAAALTREQVESGAPWSDVTIAHTLAAGSGQAIAARRLLRLHDLGAGWAAIAWAMGLDLGHMVTVVRGECRVAAGEAPADGRVARIRSGPQGITAEPLTGRPTGGSEPGTATSGGAGASAFKDGS